MDLPLHSSELVSATTTTSEPARIPVATYRVQFNTAFTFRDAERTVDYLHRLGVSDAYASSYLCAVPGSPHGYDVADPGRLNPEIGTDDDYWAWIGALRARAMGHVLDIVPNHMGIARSANPWWMDVLENGPASRYASFFDIAWRPVKDELADKVLIPTLGDQYGVVLERQELALAYHDGAFVVRYYDDWFPIAPDTYPRILALALDRWVAEPMAAEADPDIDELRSIITATDHLPPRSLGVDAEQIVTRAREKEIVKRRLAALVERCDALRARVEATLEWFNGVPGDPRSFDPLDSLLAEQSYRLAHWRTASEEINYRRFFDVNQLAALRMEDPAVFAEVHRFVFELLARGAATGLRVDHVDGLFAPGDYLRRLQARAAEALGLDTATTRPVYLVVEKILGTDERLPADWPVHGTTGYEFAAAVNGLFIDRGNETAFDRLYRRLADETTNWQSFEDLAYACRKRVMHETMSGDINSLGHQLNRFSERHRHFRDFTLYSLIATIKEVIACFPVYRTYITDPGPLSEHDRRYVDQAIRDARRRSPTMTRLVFDFVERILLHGEGTGSDSLEERDEQQRFVGKFQQITGPVAAKGIEDTAFYVYNRLLSLNEVGADPTVFGFEPAHLHARLRERQEQWPAALSTTSTHDTKRGEDVRARLNVLTEIPGEWRAAVTRWRQLNRRVKHEAGGRIAPDANEEYQLYQTLVGAWPLHMKEEPAFRERLLKYVVKALREAKVNTSWLSPDEEYENGVIAFVEKLLDPRRPFLDVFRPFQQRVAAVGMWNSLAQVLIKCTAPGVPDFYQGTELWDLSLVDPDNRRPVDYEQRREALDALLAAPAAGRPALATSLLAARADGRVKLYTIARALEVRRERHTLFTDGRYVPLAVTGAGARSVFAFARTYASGVSITCVPRLVVSLPGDAAEPPLGDACWGDTTIDLPADLAGVRLTNAFTGETLAPDSGAPQLRTADVFATFPVALLTQ
jgi:(1->4)-alpha-D-glucan 1-alpha-D-glucosylmutase